jgi:cobalt/nickel transport system permease protein
LHYDFTDQYHFRPSVVHGLDPRVKVVLAVCTILALSLLSEGAWPAFGSMFLLLLLAAGISQLGLLYAVRRSYIALPFMLAAVAVPFTVPGASLLKLPLVGWSISEPGLIRFLSVLMRSWLAVQVAILLTATTRFPDLLWALGALRVPGALVSVIGFMYRYLFVLADEANRMLRARGARSVSPPKGRGPSVVWQGRVAGAMAGSLFLRALERSERIYSAMLARGYDGRMRSMQRFHMHGRDWNVLAATAAILSLILVISRAG